MNPKPLSFKYKKVLIITAEGHFFEPTEPPERTENGEYEFVTREQFEGLPPRKEIDPLELPIRRVLIGHTVTEVCSNFVRFFSLNVFFFVLKSYL